MKQSNGGGLVFDVERIVEANDTEFIMAMRGNVATLIVDKSDILSVGTDSISGVYRVEISTACTLTTQFHVVRQLLGSGGDSIISSINDCECDDCECACDCDD